MLRNEVNIMLNAKPLSHIGNDLKFTLIVRSPTLKKISKKMRFGRSMIIAFKSKTSVLGFHLRVGP